MPPKRLPMNIEYENEEALDRARIDLLQRKWEVLTTEKTDRGWKLTIMPPMKR